ncbi:MAG: carboxylate-amine ligase, partial [Nocardioidaceae bacterium]
MSVRKVGVEEELMLVDPLTGELAAVSHRVLKAGRLQSAAGHSDESDPVESEPQKSAGFESIEQEIFLQQLETATSPCTELSEVAVEIRRCRAVATAAAQAAGVEVVASGTPVLGGFELTVTPKPRYRLIYDESGEIGRHALACGMHVHVDVADDEEGVGVLDRIRPWLPVLLAVSANSPYAEGQDSGFASWRSQVWG